MWAIIATWRMAKEAIEESLDKRDNAADLIVEAIKRVEDFPYFKSVGYGGLPNEEMEVELDAAFMDGDTLSIGAVAALKNIENPILVARDLSKHKVNNFLVGNGARKYALNNGFKEKIMLSDRAKIHYFNRLKELENTEISPYSGHDTVGMVALDNNNSMVAATSTSGLFMKKSGRVGDSPVVGSGLYVDSEVGGAVATGLGEDLMKGVVSYEVVRLIKDGYTPQAACEKVVFELDEKLKAKREDAGDISIVALNNKGEFGAASNINDFSFVIVSEHIPLRVYRTIREGDKMIHTIASEEWIEDYIVSRSEALE